MIGMTTVVWWPPTKEPSVPKAVYKRLLLCNKAMEQQPRHPAHTRHGLCGERKWLRSQSPWEDPVLCLVWMALPKLCTSVCQPKMDLDLWAKPVSDALSSMTRLSLHLDGG